MRTSRMTDRLAAKELSAAEPQPPSPYPPGKICPEGTKGLSPGFQPISAKISCRWNLLVPEGLNDSSLAQRARKKEKGFGSRVSPSGTKRFIKSTSNGDSTRPFDSQKGSGDCLHRSLLSLAIGYRLCAPALAPNVRIQKCEPIRAKLLDQ
jgi:hypothetical protein